MKILYTNFHDGDGGGHTTYILSLARALSARHRVTIAAPLSSRLYQSASEIPGVEVVALEFRNRLGAMVGSGWKLRQLIENKRFDIVHVNGSADHRIVMLAALGLRRTRPRIVFTKHNDLPVSGLSTWLKGKLGTDSVICVSNYTRRRLAKTVYDRKVVWVVHHGVDLRRFAPVRTEVVERLRNRWCPVIPRDALLVGSVAGTESNKGWLNMVAAVALLPASQRERIRIVVAGQLPDTQQRARVAALGMTDHVIFTGVLSDVRPVVAALDVGFVLSQRETLSFACREMMAMGKPVIVSDSGGLPENVDAGVNGWIVAPHEHERMAQLLMRLLGNRLELTLAGMAARARSVAQFSLQAFAERTEAVYQECLARIPPSFGKGGVREWSTVQRHSS
ncbi:glycosyltransferase [Paraburkholderia phenazinium]|uniref:Glycosyltransferase involved in cell wall bisynthesis n=1 Tax=Paraburkholderia phenazinium TaxID=60549 RepID=A0A1G7SH43_9BURK|nr:glycosyltransferase [Paraburkholderia phenazinium]SDG22232.1 Glycosyltransferase involved in cell wall bisynthesis [Paraburkholderia phenazinium]